MPKTRSARLAFALVACFALMVIGRNLYRRNLDSRLVAAVEAGNVNSVRFLLARGADPNTKKMYSVEKGLGSPLLSLLLDYYLVAGTSEEQKEIACLLIEHGADIREDAHESYLEKACSKGAVPVVRALLAHGANAAFVDVYHSTPLDYAIQYMDLKTADVATAAASTATSVSPVSIPSGSAPSSSPSLSANVSVPLLPGFPSATSNRTSASQRLAAGREIIHLLQQRGAGLTPWQAVRVNDLTALRAALDTKFDVEAKEQMRPMFSSGRPTLLQAAAQCGNQEAVRLLLERGANVNASEEYNPSPLAQAIAARDEQCARILLAHKADVNRYPGDAGLLPRAVKNLPSLVPALLEHGADLKKQGVPALCEAIRDRQPALVMLLQKGVSCRGEAGRPALSAAIQYRPDLVPALLAQGAEARDTARTTGSLLWEAVHYDREECILPLLRAGANVNPSSSVSPLLEAIGKNSRVVKLLLDNGADPNKASGYNPLPLSAAAQGGNIEAARLLLLHGADVNGRGHLSHTPLYFARKHKQAKMIALLQEAGGKE